MNKRLVLHSISRIVLIEAGLLMLPMLVSVYYGESGCVKVFLSFALAIAVLSLPTATFLLKPKNNTLGSREGIAIAALCWIIVPILGAMPFYISGAIPSFCDALFESVSGFTTTGSTILSDIEAMPRGMLFWRSFTHWVGGMGVLVLVIAIMPSDKNSSALHMMRAECAGPQVGKLVPKGKSTALILYVLYGSLTVIEIIFLLAGKMPLFDSVCHAMGTAGTGGFGVKNAGIAVYDSPYLEGVLTVFMILFGVNFNLYYFMAIRKFSEVLKNSELRVYLGIMLFSTVLIMGNIHHIYESVGRSFRFAVFQVSSVMTSTGFATADYNQWPEFSKMVLIILMFVGACAGSTGGGFKVSRFIIMFKTSQKSLRKVLHPKSVNVVKADDKALDIETVHGVHSYLIIYITVMLVSLLLVSLNNLDFATTTTSVITCVNNIGPGISKIGPMSNFSIFSDFSKYILSIDMLLGRLECLPLIMLFSPSIWSRKF